MKTLTWTGPLLKKERSRLQGKPIHYWLADLTGSLLQRDVPINQIRLIESGDRRSRNELNETHYEIEAIVNHRKTDDGKFEYLTAFVGYDEPEWIIESNFDSKATISEYWTKRKAVERQQQGHLNTLPKPTTPRRSYNRKNFNPDLSNKKSSNGSSDNSAPTKRVRRSNRSNK